MAKCDCEKMQELLYDYAEGLLPLTQKAMVAHHLQHCNACAKELVEIKQITALLQNLPEQPLPEDFNEKLHLALLAAAAGLGDGANEVNEANETVPGIAPFASPVASIEALQAQPKKPLWQRAWFPRSIAAAIVLLFGVVSTNYANEHFGFWGTDGKNVLYETAALDSAKQPAEDALKNAEAPPAMMSTLQEQKDAESNAEEIKGNEEATLPGEMLAAKALPYDSILKNPLSLASRENCTHEAAPLLPEASVLKKEAEAEVGTFNLNNHIASDEAADKNYCWKDYDYAKLNLLVKDTQVTLKKAAGIGKSFQGIVCKEFHGNMPEASLTPENSIMLDLPQEHFDAALAKLSELGAIQTCYLPDTAASKKYTFEQNGIAYRSIVVIAEAE